MGQIYSNRLLPWYLWEYGTKLLKSLKIRHSYWRPWPWCEADWLWQPVLEDEQFTSQFSEMAGCGRGVFSVSSLPTGIVMGMKSQLIRTKPWPFGNKNCQTCVTMTNVVDDERMWSPACTAKSEWSYSCELFPDVTFVHSSFDICPCSKCSTGATIYASTGGVRQVRADGLVRLPILAHHALPQTSLQKIATPRTSCGAIDCHHWWAQP